LSIEHFAREKEAGCNVQCHRDVEAASPSNVPARRRLHCNDINQACQTQTTQRAAKATKTAEGAAKSAEEVLSRPHFIKLSD